MKKLSLIIATYSRSASLVRTLRSVAAQDAPKELWECVVVDNNSTDDTAEQFARFAAEHRELDIRMVRETSQGLSFARNRGIAESTGEILAIIDDDEEINAEFVSAYIEFFDAYPAVSAAGGRIIPRYEIVRPRWMSTITERPIANPIDFGNSVKLFPAGRIPGGGNMAVRRSLIDEYGAFNTSLGRVGKTLAGGEESDLFERLSKAGERYYYIPEAVMWHIIPPEKLTGDYFDRLCYNIGISQRVRARINGRGVVVPELWKWCVTI